MKTTKKTTTKPAKKRRSKLAEASTPPSTEFRIVVQDGNNTEVAFSSPDPKSIGRWVVEWLKDHLGMPLLVIPPGKLASERATHGVFLYSDVTDEIPAVLLRKCASIFEAVGWKEFWHCDGFLDAKMVVHRIDAAGQPIDTEEGGDQ